MNIYPKTSIAKKCHFFLTQIDNICFNNPCLNGATCQLINTGSYVCLCAAYYSGVNCQTYANPCTNNPCLNGGSCSVNGNSYTCTCLSGYSGTTCNTCKLKIEKYQELLFFFYNLSGFALVNLIFIAERPMIQRINKLIDN